MGTGYRPTMSAAEQARLRAWHERVSEELHVRGQHEVSYLGLDLIVPAHVFPPTPVSDLLGRAVLAEVRPGDRVLDMGTGSGANALLAARISAHVTGVDVNPHAVAAAAANAERNGLGDRTCFREGDLFDAVDGRFDVVIFDPPFRWFTPRDHLDRAITDEGYRTLTRFVDEVAGHLTPTGRVLLCFGTSGDLGYLQRLLADRGFDAETVASRTKATVDGDATYLTFRLTPRAHA